VACRGSRIPERPLNTFYFGLIPNKRTDFGAPLVHTSGSNGAVGIGVLAVGNIKYQLQNKLLAEMLSTETPVYLDFRDAFQRARAC